jgi:hypothetical protein
LSDQHAKKKKGEKQNGEFPLIPVDTAKYMFNNGGMMAKN